MVSESLQSPNAIPPRTSSSGLNLGFVPAAKPVLKPVPEGDWISHGKTVRRASSSASPSNRPRPNISEMPLGDGTTWSPEKEKILLGPYDYMVDQPGKNIRRQLISAFNIWLKVPEKSLAVITEVVGMLHTASLLVDDVEDSSLLRRGVPVAHSIFGTAQTLNSANYVYFIALQELLKLNNPRTIQIYTDELCNLHRGQGMDLFWRDTLTCPSEEDYLEMVGNKTGGLFRLAVQLMQAESTSSRDFIPLVNLIGLIFQIRDDYMNLHGTDYTRNKGLCEDLTEGKFSFPVIHSIRSNPQNLQLINILKQKPTDETVKRYAVSYMESTGSFVYTKKVIRELIEKAQAMVHIVDQGAGESEGVRAILSKLVVE
ncbi:geranylgeranyl pyrophosphate synthetase [Lambiella insularis]|nr:geranylgeranyl pyrophosphate synthetase [Lambiella insularis]